MKHVAAYLLAVLGGNDSPSVEDVKTILASVGVDADEERLAKLVADFEGKDINEIIANGTEKLAKFGGGAAVAGGAAAAAGDAAPAEEEKKEEEEEEADLGGAMDMFGGDDY